MTPHIQGGQGRTPSDIEAGGYVMLFTLAVAVCLVLLLIVNAWFGGVK